MDYNYNVAGSYNFNKDTFLASIDREGNIIHEGANGRKKIGVDVQTADEMQGVIDNYYNKLVELGVFVKEKTPEEIAQELAREQLEISQKRAEEQAEINQALLAEIRNLNKRVERMSENVGYDNQTSSTSTGQKSAGDPTSIKSSKKNDTQKNK